MRAKQVKRISSISNCNVCKEPCLDDEFPKVIFRINPNYCGRITRSIKRVLDRTKDFIVIEVYRCMPLLGGEEDMFPHWDVHVRRYAVVFTGKTEEAKQTKY